LVLVQLRLVHSHLKHIFPFFRPVTISAPCCMYPYVRILGYLLKLKEVREQKYFGNTAISHSDMQSVRSSTLVGGFTVNTTIQLICNYQHTNKTNGTTTITIQHNKLLYILSQHPPHNYCSRSCICLGHREVTHLQSNTPPLKEIRRM
jgi:hypothetical protein